MLTKYLSCPLLLTEASFINNLQLTGFLTFLNNRGYAHGTIRYYLGVIVHFESWRRPRNERPSQVLIDDINLFVDQHLAQCKCPRAFPRHKITARVALNHWMRILLPTPTDTKTPPAHAQLVRSYDNYLEEVAGLAPATRLRHRSHSLKFLDWLFEQSLVVSQLTGKHLNDYIAVNTVSRSAATVAVMTTSLKSFIGFLGSEGQCSAVWNPALPGPKVPHAITCIRALSTEELNRLLKAFDRTYAVGKRDYAMARCLADLGIRTSDAAQLCLDQIDWRHGRITLGPGKSKRKRILPLPATTKEALIDYVHCGRPATQDRFVFVHHRAPVGQGVLASTVRCALRRAFLRAGVDTSESQVHRLRHSMATRMLQNRNSLKIIADVLGHQDINTTTRYAHVDGPSLTAVAMPWPGRVE